MTAERLTAADLGEPLGTTATLVEISSAFCAPCRTARRVLERAAATDPGVTFVDLDVVRHVDLGERLDVRATPTVLVLDADGVVRRQAAGVPTLAQVRAAVAQVAGAPTARRAAG